MEIGKQTQALPTFVARIWLEPGPDGTPRWRGKVRHVQQDSEIYFGTLRELRDFLEEVSGVPGIMSDGKDQDGG